jgi:putative polyhydroxyalkanoate system protein
MADIHIEREHGMGLAAARKAAVSWAEQAKSKFDLECSYEEGAAGDEVRFSRSGVSGALGVTGTRFTLDAKLGFLLGAFKERIEAEIARNLDKLVAGTPPGGQSVAAAAAPNQPQTQTQTQQPSRPPTAGTKNTRA